MVSHWGHNCYFGRVILRRVDIYDARIIKNPLNSTVFWKRRLNPATRRLNSATRPKRVKFYIEI